MHLNTALQNTKIELYVSYILMFLIKKLYMPYGTNIEYVTKQTQTTVFKRKTKFGDSALPAGPSVPPLYNERTDAASRLRTSDYAQAHRLTHVPATMPRAVPADGSCTCSCGRQAGARAQRSCPSTCLQSARGPGSSLPCYHRQWGRRGPWA